MTDSDIIEADWKRDMTVANATATDDAEYIVAELADDRRDRDRTLDEFADDR